MGASYLLGIWVCLSIQSQSMATTMEDTGGPLPPPLASAWPVLNIIMCMIITLAIHYIARPHYIAGLTLMRGCQVKTMLQPLHCSELF